MTCQSNLETLSNELLAYIQNLALYKHASFLNALLLFFQEHELIQLNTTHRHTQTHIHCCCSFVLFKLID